MNHLLARLKGRSETMWKVMSQDADFYSIPNLTSSQVYDPRYKLDEEEWHRLENYSEKGFRNSVIGEELNTANFNQISLQDYSKILFLACKQDEYWLFQKLTPSQFLRKRWFRISEAPTLRVDEPIIVLNNFLDAVYDIGNDTLYFRDLARVKQIFRGIEELYREATQEEVAGFLGNDFLSLESDYSAESVKSANRKRIALVLDRLAELEEDEVSTLLQYTAEYCTDIQFEDGAFSVSSEDELKRVLYGIEERYYTTRLGQEKRLANSIKTLGGA